MPSFLYLPLRLRKCFSKHITVTDKYGHSSHCKEQCPSCSIDTYELDIPKINASNTPNFSSPARYTTAYLAIPMATSLPRSTTSSGTARASLNARETAKPCDPAMDSRPQPEYPHPVVERVMSTTADLDAKAAAMREQIAEAQDDARTSALHEAARARGEVTPTAKSKGYEERRAQTDQEPAKWLTKLLGLLWYDPERPNQKDEASHANVGGEPEIEASRDSVGDEPEIEASDQGRGDYSEQWSEDTFYDALDEMPDEELEEVDDDWRLRVERVEGWLEGVWDASLGETSYKRMVENALAVERAVRTRKEIERREEAIKEAWWTTKREEQIERIDWL